VHPAFWHDYLFCSWSGTKTPSSANQQIDEFGNLQAKT
jgi:hypothetical protein